MHEGNDVPARDQHLAHLGEQRAASSWLEFGDRLLPEFVIGGIAVARGIIARPMIRCGGNLTVSICFEMRAGIGASVARGVHLQVGLEAFDRVG